MKLIILDREGTINVESDDFIKTPDEWVPLPGALEAIAKLNHAGWHTIVASNQSGLGRGLFDVAALNAIHAKMHKLLGAAGGRMDAVFYCPHTPTDNCSCRKPLPGLFNQIIERTSVEAHTIACAGDSLRDVQAAAAAGCEPHLVLTGKAAHLRGQPLPDTFPATTVVHEDLNAFADFVIARQKEQEKAQIIAQEAAKSMARDKKAS
ncbi:MAG: D-glycero-beta-D-manno-heptose 1,7-bisphosphate 7-phosphatase [Burkholderiaceae bacterium]|nr:D-glycero-beta-D-manno-heptose 1,7-bisphosphate 7-phosphatase [Burkholderiaceae bacterium]